MTNAYSVYLEANINHQLLERQIRQCQDTQLLPGLNYLFEQSAIALEDKFHAWSAEVDKLLSQPVIPEIPVTRHLVAVGGWHSDADINQTPGVA